jgi:hypothetical protein
MVLGRVRAIVVTLGLLAWDASLLVPALEAQDDVDAEAVVPPVPPDTPTPPTWPADVPHGAAVEVLTEVVVSDTGTVSEAAVLSSEAPPPRAAAFEAAALAHVRSLRFTPARRGTTPIAARIRLRVVIAPPPTSSDAVPPVDETLGPSTSTSGGPPELDVSSAEAGGAQELPRDDAGEVSAPTARAEAEGTTQPDAGEDAEEDAEEDGGEELTEFGARAEVAAPEAPAVSASERDIEVGALGRVPRRDAQAMLTLAPGILLSNHGGEGHAASMFLRGFDAEEGEDLEVLVDGIPLNDVSNAHGHGYVDTSFLIPELVEGLRVVQGPFDPSQGDFAVAGTAEYRLGLPQRGIHALLGYGSYHDRRLALFWGPEGEPSATFVGVSFKAGDGWGSNRAYGSAAALAQVEARLSEEWILRVLFLASTSSWRQAGALRLDEYRARTLPCAADDFAQFFCTYDSTQGGAADRAGGAVTLRWRSGPTRARLLVHAVGHALRVRENFTGFVGDPRADGGPQRGDALDQRYEALTIGARAELEHRFSMFGRVQHVHVGLAARYDDTSATQDRIRAELAVPYRSDFDRAIRVTGLGAFARVDADLFEWLALTGGLRFDAFGFGVLDRNRPVEDRIGDRLPREASSAFGYLAQPRGTLRIRLLPGMEDLDLDWVTSAGVGARSSDAAALSEGELAPFAEVFSLESGFAVRGGDQAAEARGAGVLVEAGTSVYTTRVSSDLVFDATRGRNTPTGPSSRVGWMAFGRLRWDAWLDASVSLTWTRGHLSPPGASAVDLFAGPRLPFIPEWLLRVDSAARRTFTIDTERFEGSLAVGAVLLGERPLPFDQFAEPFFVLDAAVSARWRWFEIGVAAENLFDARYRQAELNYVSSFEPDRAPSLMAARHFVAGPPLRVMVRLAIHVELGGST